MDGRATYTTRHRQGAVDDGIMQGPHIGPSRMASLVLMYDSVQSQQSLSALSLLRGHLSDLAVVIPLHRREILESLGVLLSGCSGLRTLHIHGAKRMNLARDEFPMPESVYECNWLVQSATNEVANPHLSDLELTNFCVCHCLSMREWEMAVNWRSVRRIKLTCLSFLERLGTVLSNVKQLSLRIDSIERGRIRCCPVIPSSGRINSGLLALPVLNTLELYNGTAAIEGSLIFHLSSTLVKFHVTEDYHTDTDPDHMVLSPELLHALGSSATLLVDLKLDALMRRAAVRKPTLFVSTFVLSRLIVEHDSCPRLSTRLRRTSSLSHT